MSWVWTQEEISFLQILATYSNGLMNANVAERHSGVEEHNTASNNWQYMLSKETDYIFNESWSKS